MTDVVSRLWGFAHPLRHDGIDYGDFIEQITYLLFLKMADEQDIELPKATDWPHLRTQSGVALVETYEDARQAARHARRHLRWQPESAEQPGYFDAIAQVY